MRAQIKVGAKRDGTWTAFQMRVVSNTGAYGNHGGETLFAACGEAVAVYRCPEQEGRRLHRVHQHGPGRRDRGYGLTQTIFKVKSAMDELARKLNMDPYKFRRINVVKPGDQMISIK